jgi:hypothetical protein
MNCEDCQQDRDKCPDCFEGSLYKTPDPGEFQAAHIEMFKSLWDSLPGVEFYFESGLATRGK